MGLDYDYRIYIKKENLKRALKFVYDHSDIDRVSFEITNDQLYKIDNYANGKTTKTYLDNFGIDQKVDTCILVDEDDSVIEYYLYDLTQNYQPNSIYESDFIDFYKSTDNKWWIGNIEIHINDYSSKIDNCIELQFWAATSDMSRLFAKSKSVDRYFKELCRGVEADYGCIYMENGGYRLIWAKDKEYNLTVPILWNSFEEYGFINVISDILKI
ncbi:hypothetical protein [Flavobacterium reichenbachii]|uniref:Uncharacterized protein n=1 Tax=Flavobacterium reichenbachii TaxID=362418 RepID=A0A085ZHZ4_9FLAO|nr:hypothetical protein [Flavobacterium reichenbachii]KFF04058.1 hypothetical protein IW19_00255 [Flavobacterium reichenbachii]OXB12890.1 hypothetical protein B0A68_17155 [Flavobacterium reichenbachii]